MSRMLLKRMVWVAASGGGLVFLAGCDGTTLDPDLTFNAGMQFLASTLEFLLQNIVAGY